MYLSTTHAMYNSKRKNVRLPSPSLAGHSKARYQPFSCTPHTPQLSSSVLPILFLQLPTGPRSVLKYVYHVAARLPTSGSSLIPTPPIVVLPSWSQRRSVSLPFCHKYISLSSF